MNWKDFTILVANFSDYATFIVGVLVFLLTVRKANYKILSLLLISTGIVKLVSVYFANHDILNMPLYHLIGFLELLLIYLIYQRHNFHLFWHLFAGGIVLTYVLNSIFIQSIYDVNNLALAINQLFVLVLGFKFLMGIYQRNDVPDIGRYSFFYINAGFMIYAAGAFFVYLLSSRIFEEDPSDFFHSAWILESIFNLFRLILICIGVMYSRREQ